MLIIIFWISIILIVYTLVLFPVLLWIRAKLFPQLIHHDTITPMISVVIAAYNEESEIVQRIENIFACDYPRENLEILIASDGSTDATHTLVGQFENQNVRLFEYTRRGKGQVINATIPHAFGEVLVFSDANTKFEPDALRRLIDPFADPQVGGVAGNQIYTRDKAKSLSADGEKSHWAFDTWLKQMQSGGGSITSATGAIYAIRKSLFQATPDDSMDDFMISTGVIANGFRLVFEQEAIAIEPVATKSTIEWKRKIRVMTQGLRSVMHRRALLNPFRYGFYSIQLFTHKVLRRALVIPLLAVFVTSPLLWNAGVFYQLVAITQFAILIAGIIGLFLAWINFKQFKVFAIPYFFLMVNVAALVALCNTITCRRIQKWEPERHGLNSDSASSNVNQTMTS